VDANRWPQRGDVYEHYKDSHWYVVIGIAICDEGHRQVVYGPVEQQPLIRDLYVQSVHRFTQTMPNHEPRFLYVRTLS
jgi:hypothetical protein